MPLSGHRLELLSASVDKPPGEQQISSERLGPEQAVGQKAEKRMLISLGIRLGVSRLRVATLPRTLPGY